MRDENAVELLIDGIAGIYSYNELINRYTVYSETPDGYEKFSDRIERDNKALGRADTLETIFNPDNPGNLLRYFRGKLYVSIEGVFYSVVSIDGDIFAVHPDAIYDPDEDTYRF